jgi:hypothetical protein
MEHIPSSISHEYRLLKVYQSPFLAEISKKHLDPSKKNDTSVELNHAFWLSSRLPIDVVFTMGMIINPILWIG